MRLELLNPFYIDQYLEMKESGSSTFGLRRTVILWMDAITDRSLRDVNRVKELLEKGYENFSDEEKEEWSGNMKGSLNYSDLERIQNNIQLLSDVLELDLQVDFVQELPNEVFFDQLISNVEAIRNAYCTYETTPKTPEVPLNTFSKWNDIEQILLDVYKILLSNFHYYSGRELYAGDTTGLLL